MAVLSEDAFLAKFMLIFAPNTTQAIRAASMQTLVQDMRDSIPTWVTAGGGGSSGIGSSVQTVGTLDFAGLPLYVFTINGIGGPLSITHLNSSAALSYDIALNITSTLGVITFPSNYLMDDLRWDGTAHTWSPKIAGLYPGRAVYFDGNWVLTIALDPYLGSTGGGVGVFDISFDPSFN